MASVKEQFAKKKEQKQSKRTDLEEIDGYSKSAKIYYQQGDLELAIEKYTKYIKSISHIASLDKNKDKFNSYFAESYNFRGICYYGQKNYTLAIEDYTQAISRSKGYSGDKLKFDEIYNSRALCYIKLDKDQLAFADYNKAIQLNPCCYSALNNRGNYYSKQKRYELALDDFNKSVQIEPNDYVAYVSRGNCYVEQENYEIALADFNKAIELNPDAAIAYNNRSVCYLKLGEDELALNDYKKSWLKKYNKDSAVASRTFETKILDFEKLNFEELNFEEENASLKKKLKEKNKELNNLIAMFAHNFLGTLQCIRSNAEHDNNPKIHLKTVKMMSGALTAFSIISADDDKLIEQLKQDNAGETNLLQNLANNLALAVSQLLSKTNKDKIINIYLNYLQKTAQIKPETNGEDLRFNEDDWGKWQALQHQWDDEFNALFSEHVELSTLTKWINDNFFPIEIIGFEDYPIHFKEYGITDSIFLVVLMETLVNALKYIDVKANKPLILRLGKQNNTYQLSCENPSQQESYRGTHKGMDFLQTIAHKLNGEFISESSENTFKSTFSIPAQLLD